jgi:hypothetical protein
MKCSKNLTLLQFKFRIQLQNFKRKNNNQKHFAEAKTLDDSEMASCPRDDDLKNGSCRKGEREHTCKITARQSMSN